jgi:hypothetical protein
MDQFLESPHKTRKNVVKFFKQFTVDLNLFRRTILSDEDKTFSMMPGVLEMLIGIISDILAMLPSGYIL